MNYYIADLHLGHTNVIRMDNRPFESIEEMDRQLIDNWNSRVKKKDTVYILGDFSMKGPKAVVEYLKQLNGNKVLIKGNHDRINTEAKNLFLEITPYKELHDGNSKVILCHYPITFYNRQHAYSIMLYGHVHNTAESKLLNELKLTIREQGIPVRMFNTGCMMPWMDYFPRTLAEILEANK